MVSSRFSYDTRAHFLYFLHNSEEDEHKDNLIKHEPCDKEEEDSFSPSDDDVLAKVQIKKEKTKKKR
jgi:hypothetical protein